VLFHCKEKASHLFWNIVPCGHQFGGLLANFGHLNHVFCPPLKPNLFWSPKTLSEDVFNQWVDICINNLQFASSLYKHDMFVHCTVLFLYQRQMIFKHRIQRDKDTVHRYCIISHTTVPVQSGFFITNKLLCYFWHFFLKSF
jgi:hypothetical protein